jgi:hypothetical protein
MLLVPTRPTSATFISSPISSLSLHQFPPLLFSLLLPSRYSLAMPIGGKATSAPWLFKIDLQGQGQRHPQGGG